MTAGFEPARAKPIWLAVRLLNRSDKSSVINKKSFNFLCYGTLPLRHWSMTRWVSIPRLPAYRANIAVRKFEILPGVEPGSDKADATDWPRIVLQNTYVFISRIRTYDAIKQRAWVSPLWPLGNYKQLLLVFFLYGCCGIWTHEAEAWHLECHPFDRSGKQPFLFPFFCCNLLWPLGYLDAMVQGGVRTREA